LFKLIVQNERSSTRSNQEAGAKKERIRPRRSPLYGLECLWLNPRPQVRLSWAGFSRFSGHRVVKSSQESLPVLMEVDAYLNRFSPYLGVINGSTSQTPNHPASVCGVASRCDHTPTANAAPLLSLSFSQGTLVTRCRCASLVSRRHVRHESRCSVPVVGATPDLRHSCAHYRVGSRGLRPRHTCGRRFFLDLSVGL